MTGGCPHELVSGRLTLTGGGLVAARMVCDDCGTLMGDLPAQTVEARAARSAHPILTIAGDRVRPVLPELPVTVPSDR